MGNRILQSVSGLIWIPNLYEEWKAKQQQQNNKQRNKPTKQQQQHENNIAQPKTDRDTKTA